MNIFSFKHISKAFGTSKVLNDVSFDVEKGSFVSIFGSNGTGKSTLLNLIAGLSIQDAGEIIWENESSKSKVSYVFQNYRESLFPWRTAWENIALPLKLNGVSKEIRKQKVRELVNRFNIEIDLEKYPYLLSGGQQQMIAILRALITEPDLILLDEPFSAIDFQRRLFLQNKVLEIWKETKTTIIFVSHDIDEAIYMADKLIILNSGRVDMETNEIDILLDRPRNANFINTDKFTGIRKTVFEIINKI
jgi:NitT/TauT family transport system ATP-binding protein